MVGIIPYIGIKMASFDWLKCRFLPERNHIHFNVINLSLGAAAGTLAVTFTYPTDLLRRKMQMQGISDR